MKTAFTNCILLDGTEHMQPETGLTVLVDGEKITAVTRDAVPDEYAAVDLGGAYLMPGLVNLHVHLPAGGKPKKKKSDPAKLVKLLTGTAVTRRIVAGVCEASARMQLYSGVTTIRTVGGVLDIDSRLRDRIRAGKTVGPRILASDMAVSVPGGHMVYSLAYGAESADEAKAYVTKIAAGKPDWIKLMITGGVLDARVKGEPGEVKMPAEYVRAACEEAHRLGLRVAAHVESPAGVRIALENGVDSIEHGAMPDEEILRLFRERGACLVATLSPALPYALFDRSVSHASEIEQYNGKVVFEGIIECAKQCLAAGIPVGLGTDTGCPYVTHYDMWREVRYFHTWCGVSNAFALHTATLRGAQIAGIADETGSVEAGKCADLLVTKENPLEDLIALRTPQMVVARGRILAQPKVKKMPQVEGELDRFL